MGAFLGSAARLSGGLRAMRGNWKRKHNSRMFSSERLKARRFARGGEARGWHRAKTKEWNYPSSFTWLRSRSPSSQCQLLRTSSARHRCLRLRLNNRLHLYWYRPWRRHAVKAAVFVAYLCILVSFFHSLNLGFVCMYPDTFLCVYLLFIMSDFHI